MDSIQSQDAAALACAHTHATRAESCRGLRPRIKSVDAIRGLTVAGMILVNNGYSGSFDALRHAAWNGLSLSDLVFPFFLFIMGMSLCLSMSGRGFFFTSGRLVKTLKRTIVLFALGIAVNWLEMALDGRALQLEELRFWAVLQRIAVCYLLASLYVMLTGGRHVLSATLILLTLYGGLLIIGNGYSEIRSDNILYKVDVWMLGDSHLYHKSAVDPEGLLGTIGALANVLLGFRCGQWLQGGKSNTEKINRILLVGAVLVMAGYVLSFAFPYNKRIWSPSFALTTSGYCALLVGVATALEKEGGRAARRLGAFFTTFGVNALAIYIASELLAIFLGHAGISEWLFTWLSEAIVVPQLASLAYALLFVVVCWGLARWLQWRGIYIKL